MHNLFEAKDRVIKYFMKNTLFKLVCNSMIYLFIFTGCGDQEKDLPPKLLRSSTNAYFYIQNNNDAIKRVHSIMYNDTTQEYERFKIVHISDSHLSSISTSNNYIYPENLIESVKFANQSQLKINAIVATGDFISNEKKGNAILFLKSFMKYYSANNNVPSFLCTGNHDSNIIKQFPNDFLSRKEINSILFKNHTGRNYYYADVKNPQGGFFRFISLDMLDQPSNEYNTMFYAYFSQEQIDWLGNIALKENMTDKHNIIILEHYPFQKYSPDAKTYLCDGDFVHPWNMVPEIIEAYRSRTKIKKSFKNKISAGKDIHVDFNFTTTKGEFVCYLGGHDHCTAHFNIKELENRNHNLLPQKMILCTNQAPSEAGRVYNRVIREENSLTSNSFCIYAIDTQERNIYMTFFGAYQPSNKADYSDIQCIPY